MLQKTYQYRKGLELIPFVVAVEYQDKLEKFITATGQAYLFESDVQIFQEIYVLMAGNSAYVGTSDTRLRVEVEAIVEVAGQKMARTNYGDFALHCIQKIPECSLCDEELMIPQAIKYQCWCPSCHSAEINAGEVFS